MANDHFLELPKSVWGIKIAQLVLSVIILGLSAFNVYVAAFNAHALAIFTAAFTILILIYYFVAFHGAPTLYNWIALLVLECLAVIFWLSTWAVLAALYADLVAAASYDDYYYSYYYYDVKRSLSSRDIVGLSEAYTGVLIAAMTFSIINFILYCVTLGFMAIFAHRHRKANKPMRHLESGSVPYSQNEVKTDPASAPMYTQQATSVGQPEPMHAQYTAPSQVQAPISPVTSSAPTQSQTQTHVTPAQEVPGSNTYQ